MEKTKLLFNFSCILHWSQSSTNLSCCWILVQRQNSYQPNANRDSSKNIGTGFLEICLACYFVTVAWRKSMVADLITVGHPSTTITSTKCTLWSGLLHTSSLSSVHSSVGGKISGSSTLGQFVGRVSVSTQIDSSCVSLVSISQLKNLLLFKTRCNIIYLR